jgi:hypothetical protein
MDGSGPSINRMPLMSLMTLRDEQRVTAPDVNQHEPSLTFNQTK